MTSSEVAELLGKNLDEKHGVVNVRAVIEKLTDPAEAFERLLEDNSVSEWHYYGLEGLRSLAIQGRLKPKQAETVLNHTVRFAQERGADEYYRSIRAIAVSPDRAIADVVLEFARMLLEKKHWGKASRWLAFFAVGTFLERKGNVVGLELVKLLQKEAGEEKDEGRKQQLEQIATNAKNA